MKRNNTKLSIALPSLHYAFSFPMPNQPNKMSIKTPARTLHSRKEVVFSSEKWKAALGRCVSGGFYLFNLDFDLFQASQKSTQKYKPLFASI